MQPNKDNKKQSELSFLSQEKTSNALNEVIGHFKIRESFSGLNVLKRSGLSISTGLLIMLVLPFYAVESLGKAFRGAFADDADLQSKKDSFYAIKNNERISWRLLVLLLGKCFINLTVKHNLIKEGIKAFMLDDTTKNKRGEKIEGVGLVHDHTSKTMVLGFKILMAYKSGDF